MNEVGEAQFRRFLPVLLYNVKSRRCLSVALLAALIFVGCATRPPLTGPWSVQVATAGGLSGRGTGTYAIDSDGRVTVITPSGRTCTFDATGEERERIASLLSAAWPERWAGDYVPEERCCDRFEWVMIVETSRGTFSTRWIDAPLPLPRDLAELPPPWRGEAIRAACAGRMASSAIDVSCRRDS